MKNFKHIGHIAGQKTASLVAALVVALTLVVVDTSAAKPADSKSAIPADILQVIEVERAITHLTYLADDAMMGRNTPSPELDSAAEYIARQFQQWGVKPVGGTYFHHYNLQKVNLDTATNLSFTKNGEKIAIEIKREFIPFDLTAEKKAINAPVFFAGYGIDAPDLNYSDYDGIDVKGAVVVILSGEPQMENPASVFNGIQLTKYAQLPHKLQAAEARGALGVVVLNAPKTVRRLRPVGFAWPSLFPQISEAALPLRSVLKGDNTIAAIHGGEQIATLLFGSVDELKATQEEIDSLLTPLSRLIEGTTVDFDIRLKRELLPVRNVMGIVPGTSKPDEYVVIGAHYDHVGYFSPEQADVDSIYNGADDNGSGTTGMLLIAEAYSKAAQKPERSLLFVAFSGEEKGLLGSKAFVDDPPVPIESMVAMLNLDMIGRNAPDTLSIGGETRCRELADINAEENKHLAAPFTISYDIEQYFFRSDQASFALKGIPVLFYFSGEHPDYHRVGDEVDKINFQKLVGISKLCARTAWRVANLKERLPYTPQPQDER